MIVRVLDATKQFDEWCETIMQLPIALRDRYFYPNWVALHKFDSNTRALMFTCEHQGKIWTYPFLLESITHVGETKLEQTWCDIQTAYGYGGPLSNTSNTDFLNDSYSLFNEWCQSQQVVAEFVRFHPLIQNMQWVDSATKITLDRETTSLDFSCLSQTDLPFDKKTGA